MTTEELIQAIEKMNVLELAQLVKALETKFGVSAAAPVAFAAAPASAAAAPVAAAAEEQTEFDLILKEAGAEKIKVIKVVRELTNLGLREAKAAVDEAPSTILKAVGKEDGESAKKKLQDVGAVVELK
jgi:large subunit ribosomal protein L7/L12